MDRIAKNRWQVRLAALVIFLLGVAAGALALNVYNAWSRSSRREGGRAGFERMLDRLELTGEQRTQVQQILADTRKQFREARRDSEPRMEDIRRQTDERLRQVLTPEQFQRMKEEMSKRRRGRRPRESEGKDSRQ
jgi:Spy/CpxP family protein refolding chaperone